MTRSALLLGIWLVQSTPANDGKETLLDIDVQQAPATDILRLLAEVGDLNLVADPGIECPLTLTLKALPWTEVFQAVLRTCRLGEERLGEGLVRVAPLAQLARELKDQRNYQEQKTRSQPLKTTYRRLAYARAKDIAPLLRRFVSPSGDVSFDERTNTLIITDVAK